MNEEEYEEATELTPQEERMRHSESSKSLERGMPRKNREMPFIKSKICNELDERKNK